MLLCLALVGCGAVGEPLPPLLDIPQPSKGLVAVQRGDRVLLSWPPPALTTEGASVRPEKLGALTLYRAVLPGLKSAVNPDEFQAAATEPAQMKPGSTEYVENVDPSWTGRTVVYALRMANRRGEAAGLSNLAAVPILRTPPAPAVKATVTEPAVVLEWTAPPGAAYRVYRDGQLLATVDAGRCEDRQFEFDREYRYLVRGLATSEDVSAEGADSNTVVVKPEDRFPPKPPQGLIAAAVEGAVELSWSPNNEPDLAGYNVYRGTQKLNREPALSPTFRDPAPGASPRYTVTAVDRRGNESERSQEARP